MLCVVLLDSPCTTELFVCMCSCLQEGETIYINLSEDPVLSDYEVKVVGNVDIVLCHQPCWQLTSVCVEVHEVIRDG